MKKKLALMALRLLLPCLAACGSGDQYSGGISPTSRDVNLTTTVNVTKINRGFIVSSGEPGEIIDYASYADLASLSIADTYYLIYEFQYYSRVETDGTLLLKAALEFEAITIFDAFLMRSDSGTDGTPIPYLDPVTNKQMNKIEQAFRIPATADETEFQRIVFKITPSYVGNSVMKMNFYPEEQENVVVIGSGSSGCTIPMVVNEYKLSTPTLSYQASLTWDHVRGADYYEIYNNGEVLKNPDGTNLHIDVQNVSVGNSIYWNDFGAFGIYGTAIPFTVRAFSNRLGFISSDFSNTVFVTV